MPIIEIDGASAVGKSTMVKMLDNRIENVVGIYEMYDLKKAVKSTSRSSFLKNQLMLMEKYKEIITVCADPNKYYVFDTGIFDIIAYTFFYPKLYQPDWDVFDNFVEIILHEFVYSYISNALIYLKCDFKKIEIRKEGDTSRKRKSLKENYEIWKLKELVLQKIEKKRELNIIGVNADQDSEIVYKKVLELLIPEGI